MSNPADTLRSARTVFEANERKRKRTAEAYRAVFFGAPAPEDQALVRADLDAFCGVYTALLHPGSFDKTAEATGQFRVWQRINSFCNPQSRPADAGGDTGGNDGNTDISSAGPGVAERTDD